MGVPLTSTEHLRVLLAGVYDPAVYARGRILEKGLIRAGADVKRALVRGPLKYGRLAWRMLRVDYDVMLVNGKIVLVLAWLLKWWHHTPIVFDVFISDYDTQVIDRKRVKSGTMMAKILWLGDKWSCTLADHIVHDTRCHIDYFVDTFGLPREKFEEVLIGADDDVFVPKTVRHTGFNVVFHGTFIPLQGIEHILRAIKKLENRNISFTLIGDGQTRPAMLALAQDLDLKDVEWRPLLPPHDIVKALAKADIALGIFGDTPKAQRVIPNKAFEIIAMKKALITADTPAARILLENRKNCMLVPCADADAIAKAIGVLEKNKTLRLKIANAGYKTFKDTSSVQRIGTRVHGLLERWVSARP